MPRYWRNRNVSVASHVFCNSIRIKCSLPSFSRTLAEKSRRNNEIFERPESVYSCWRICTSNTSFCNKAESNTLATLLSSIRYLNTESYIGFAMIVITLIFLIHTPKIRIILNIFNLSQTQSTIQNTYRHTLLHRPSPHAPDKQPFPSSQDPLSSPNLSCPSPYPRHAISSPSVRRE